MKRQDFLRRDLQEAILSSFLQLHHGVHPRRAVAMAQHKHIWFSQPELAKLADITEAVLQLKVNEDSITKSDRNHP